MKKLITVCLMCLIMILNITGCASYKELEDSIREDAADEILSDEIPGEDQIDTEYENRSDVSDKNIFKPGEMMEYTSLFGETMQYTLEQVELFEKTEELPFSIDECLNPARVERELSTGDNLMVLLTIKVKNINIELQNTWDGVLYIESFAGSESNIKYPDGPWMLEAEYFSEGMDKERDYYKYILEKGSEKEMKIAWSVPKTLLEEPFYWVIGSGGDTANYKFFQLN